MEKRAQTNLKIMSRVLAGVCYAGAGGAIMLGAMKTFGILVIVGSALAFISQYI